jgi:hypothetical protein
MEPLLVETDNWSQVVLPGHANQRFLLSEHADGSMLLEPTRTATGAQYEYDTSPELQDLIRRAAESGYSGKRRTPL